MAFEFLSPVSDLVAAHAELVSDNALGKQIVIHTADQGIPDLEGVHIALIGVLENRNDEKYLGEELSFDV